MPLSRIHDLPPVEVLLTKSLPPRVLIVEDDKTICDVLCALLEDDYVVISVATVEEALVVLKHEHVAVVLLDFNLTGETGKAVADQADCARIPVVWMTGDPGSLGNSRVILPKPFRFQQVLEVLAKACKRPVGFAV